MWVGRCVSWWVDVGLRVCGCVGVTPLLNLGFVDMLSVLPNRSLNLLLFIIILITKND